MYGERERKRLKKKNKDLDITWSKSEHKWLMKTKNAQGNVDFRPFHRSIAPPKMVAGRHSKEYKEKNLDAKWM